MMLEYTIRIINLLKNTVRVKIKTNLDASEIYVKGSWDNWMQAFPLSRRYITFAENYENYAYMLLAP